jgi:RNA polymerase sigma factor (sigma-70 family)
MPLLEFTGPPELKPAWDDFAARFSNGGKNESRVTGINLLLEYILDEGPTSEFIQKHSAIPFPQLKRHIDDVCTEQAAESSEKGPRRDLNDFIVTKLVQRWIALSEAAGFYPPPEHSNVTRETKDRRDALRASKVGGLISSAIQASCVPTVYGATGEVRRILAKSKADLSTADSLAIPVLENSLFSFNDEKGVNRDKSTGRRFKDYVYGRVKTIVLRALGSNSGDMSMDQQTGHSDERSLHDKIADKRSVDPAEHTEKQDRIAKLLEILEKMRPRDQEVIKMRFGINEEQRSYTLEEVGRELGLTRERIRQIEDKAMKLLRERAMRVMEKASIVPVAAAVPVAARSVDEETIAQLQHSLRVRTGARQQRSPEEAGNMLAIKTPHVARNAAHSPAATAGASEDAVIPAMPEATPPRVGLAAQAVLNTCFAEPNPVIDSNAMGVERAFHACTFFKMLREAHGCADIAELAQRIAADNIGMDTETLRGSIIRMRVPEDELGKPPTERAKTRTYRTTINEEDAEAIATFAYPKKAQEELRNRCKEFLSSRKYWVRKLKDTAPRTADAGPESHEAPTLGFRQTSFNNTDAKLLQEVEALVRTAREAFADMKVYDREKAEAIATELFNGLIAGYSHSRLETLSRGELNGKETHINGSTLTRWRSGRKVGETRIPQKVDIDTVMQVADALAHSIIPHTPEGRPLMEEAASYMSALPWASNKPKQEVLDYVLGNNLDTAAYMLLTRRQMRMQQHEFEKFLQLPHERFSEMIAPADRKYAARINLGDFEGFIERQGFDSLEDKARFRKMLVRKAPEDFEAQQAAVVEYCRDNGKPAGAKFIAGLCEKLQQLHGTRNAEELAEAICNHEQRTATAPLAEQARILKRDLKKISNGEDVALPRELVRWVMDFALPTHELEPLREEILEGQRKATLDAGHEGHINRVESRAELPVGSGKY